MDGFKKEEGFTIIEVLIALTILVIIIFSFTTLYTTSFTGIFRAGDKSEALFDLQEEIDNAIAEGPSSEFEEATLTIKFDNEEVTVSGKPKHIVQEYEDRSVDLFYFLPDQN